MLLLLTTTYSKPRYLFEAPYLFETPPFRHAEQLVHIALAYTKILSRGLIIYSTAGKTKQASKQASKQAMLLLRLFSAALVFSGVAIACDDSCHLPGAYEGKYCKVCCGTVSFDLISDIIAYK